MCLNMAAQVGRVPSSVSSCRVPELSRAPEPHQGPSPLCVLSWEAYTLCSAVAPGLCRHLPTLLETQGCVRDPPWVLAMGKKAVSFPRCLHSKQKHSGYISKPRTEWVSPFPCLSTSWTKGVLACDTQLTCASPPVDL